MSDEIYIFQYSVVKKIWNNMSYVGENITSSTN